jgi:hypothetical protein
MHTLKQRVLTTIVSGALAACGSGAGSPFPEPLRGETHDYEVVVRQSSTNTPCPQRQIDLILLSGLHRGLPQRIRAFDYDCNLDRIDRIEFPDVMDRARYNQSKGYFEMTVASAASDVLFRHGYTNY